MIKLTLPIPRSLNSLLCLRPLDQLRLFIQEPPILGSKYFEIHCRRVAFQFLAGASQPLGRDGFGAFAIDILSFRDDEALEEVADFVWCCCGFRHGRGTFFRGAADFGVQRKALFVAAVGEAGHFVVVVFGDAHFDGLLVSDGDGEMMEQEMALRELRAPRCFALPCLRRCLSAASFCGP